jgi:hypothetical protein
MTSTVAPVGRYTGHSVRRVLRPHVSPSNWDLPLNGRVNILRFHHSDLVCVLFWLFSFGSKSATIFRLCSPQNRTCGFPTSGSSVGLTQRAISARAQAFQPVSSYRLFPMVPAGVSLRNPRGPQAPRYRISMYRITIRTINPAAITRGSNTRVIFVSVSTLSGGRQPILSSSS